MKNLWLKRSQQVILHSFYFSEHEDEVVVTFLMSSLKANKYIYARHFTFCHLNVDVTQVDAAPLIYPSLVKVKLTGKTSDLCNNSLKVIAQHLGRIIQVEIK